MNDTLLRVRRCMQTTLQLSDETMSGIGPETTPLMLPAWDSMAHVRLILELERVFDVTFDADAIGSMASVGAIVAVLDRQRA